MLSCLDGKRVTCLVTIEKVRSDQDTMSEEEVEEADRPEK